MGWLGDAVKDMFGMDDGQRAWREAVISAERNVRWGAQARSAGDFKRALTALDLCPESSAPGPHYLFRRERAAAESHLWLARLTLENLSRQAAKLDDHFTAVDEGRKSLAAQTEASRTRVVQLEAEGSIISAREERRRLEDMEREGRDLPDLSAERLKRLADLFARGVPLFQEHRGNAGKALEALRAVAGLVPEDAQIRDGHHQQLQATLATLDSAWKELTSQYLPPREGQAPRPPPAKR